MVSSQWAAEAAVPLEYVIVPVVQYYGYVLLEYVPARAVLLEYVPEHEPAGHHQPEQVHQAAQRENDLAHADK